MNGTFLPQPGCCVAFNRSSVAMGLVSLALSATLSFAQQPGAIPGVPGTAAVNVHSVTIPFDRLLAGIDDAGDIVALGSYSLGFIYDGSSPRITLLKISHNTKTDFAAITAFSSGGLALAASPSAGQVIYDAHSKTFRGTTTLPASLNSAIVIAGMNNSLQVAANLGDSPLGYLEGAVYGTVSTGEVGAQVAHVDYKIFKCPDQALTHAEAISNRGQIVGTCYFTRSGARVRGETRGFLFDISSGAMTTFTYPGATETYPKGINDKGVIVGYFMNSFAPGQSRGSFRYDGAQFERLMPAPGQAKGGPIARGINNQGVIVGTFGSGLQGRSFVAVPSGVSEPAVVASLNPEQLSRLNLEALKREPDDPPSDQSSRFRTEDRSGPDPNFPPPGGNNQIVLTPAFSVSYVYRRDGAQPQLTSFNREGDLHYMGFNAEGSWFRYGNDALIYVWNRSQNTLSCTTNGVLPDLQNNDRFRPLPPNQPAFDDPPGAFAQGHNPAPQTQSQGQSQAQAPTVDYAALIASVQPPVPAGFAPYGQNASITRQPDGTMQLSYTLKYPGVPDSIIRVPVVRPLPKTPAPGLPTPTLSDGTSGSWLWFGVGDKKGTAVFFTLESSGHLTWLFMPSDIAATYLPPGSAH